MALLDRIKSAASKTYKFSGETLTSATTYVGQKYEKAEQAVRQTITNVSNGARSRIDKVMQGVASFAPLAEPAGYTGEYSSIQPQMPAKPMSQESAASVMQALSGRANLNANSTGTAGNTMRPPAHSTEVVPTSGRTLPPPADSTFIPPANSPQDPKPSTMFSRGLYSAKADIAANEADRLRAAAEKRAEEQRLTEAEKQRAAAEKQAALRANVEQLKMEAQWYSRGLTTNPNTGLLYAYDQEAQQILRDFKAVSANNAKAAAEFKIRDYKRAQNSMLTRLTKAVAPNYYIEKYSESGKRYIPTTRTIAGDIVSGAKNWLQTKAAGIGNWLQTKASNARKTISRALGTVTDKYVFNADDALTYLIQQAKETPTAVPQARQLSDLDEEKWFNQGAEINPSTGYAYCHDQAVAGVAATIALKQDLRTSANEQRLSDEKRKQRPERGYQETLSLKGKVLRFIAPNYVLRKVEQADANDLLEEYDNDAPYVGVTPYRYIPSAGEVASDAATGLKERASKLLKGLGRGIGRAASYITKPLFNNRLVDRLVYDPTESLKNMSLEDPKPNSVQITPPSERGNNVDQTANTVMDMAAHNSADDSSTSGSGSDTPTLPPSGGNGGNEDEPPNGDEPKKKAGFWSENRYLKIAFAGLLAAAAATGIWATRTPDSTQKTQVAASAGASSTPKAPQAHSAAPKPSATALATNADAGIPDAAEDVSGYVSTLPSSTATSAQPALTSSASEPATAAKTAQPAPNATTTATSRPAPRTASTSTSRPAQRATNPSLPARPPKVAYNNRSTTKDPRTTINPDATVRPPKESVEPPKTTTRESDQYVPRRTVNNLREAATMLAQMNVTACTPVVGYKAHGSAITNPRIEECKTINTELRTIRTELNEKCPIDTSKACTVTFDQADKYAQRLGARPSTVSGSTAPGNTAAEVAKELKAAGVLIGSSVANSATNSVLDSLGTPSVEVKPKKTDLLKANPDGLYQAVNSIGNSTLADNASLAILDYQAMSANVRRLIGDLPATHPLRVQAEALLTRNVNKLIDNLSVKPGNTAKESREQMRSFVALRGHYRDLQSLSHQIRRAKRLPGVRVTESTHQLKAEQLENIFTLNPVPGR